MIKVTCTLHGSGSEIGFNAPIVSTKKPSERHDDFEERTWRERMHVDDNGEVYLLPTSIKNCLVDVATYLSETIPGKGKATYTKHIKSGVNVVDPLRLGVKAADVKCVSVFVPSDGKRGGGARVWKKFPVIPAGWETKVTLYITDPVVKPEKLEEYLRHAGVFIGLGWFRPQRGGYYGRFGVKDFKWEEMGKAVA